MDKTVNLDFVESWKVDCDGIHITLISGQIHTIPPYLSWVCEGDCDLYLSDWGFWFLCAVSDGLLLRRLELEIKDRCARDRVDMEERRRKSIEWDLAWGGMIE